MFFSGEKYVGGAEALVLKVDEEDMQEYTPDYDVKVELFKATYRWINPKKK